MEESEAGRGGDKEGEDRRKTDLDTGYTASPCLTEGWYNKRPVRTVWDWPVIKLDINHVFT